MKFVKSNVVYKGKRVLLEEATYIDKKGNLRVMEHVKVQPAVAILGVTESNKFVLIKTKRTAIGNSDVLEIPAGKVENGECPKKAAIRELKEETGYVTDDMELLTTFYSSPGFTDEKKFIFLANGLKIKEEQELEDTEEIEVVETSKDEVIEMLKNGVFSCGTTQLALTWYFMNKEEDKNA